VHAVVFVLANKRMIKGTAPPQTLPPGPLGREILLTRALKLGAAALDPL